MENIANDVSLVCNILQNLIVAGQGLRFVKLLALKIDALIVQNFVFDFVFDFVFCLKVMPNWINVRLPEGSVLYSSYIVVVIVVVFVVLKVNSELY